MANLKDVLNSGKASKAGNISNFICHEAYGSILKDGKMLDEYSKFKTEKDAKAMLEKGGYIEFSGFHFIENDAKNWSVVTKASLSKNKKGSRKSIKMVLSELK